MPLRLKLFLGIVLFFTIAFTFFGHTAFDAAVQSGSKRELVLLKDLSLSLSQDLSYDIGSSPDEKILEAWLGRFKNPDIALVVTQGEKSWANTTAKKFPEAVIQKISTSSDVGTTTFENVTYAWHTAKILTPPYSINIIHRSNAEEARNFFKSMVLTLVITGLIVIWAAVWCTMFVASLIDQLKHSALHDALTGLPNRTLMRDRLEMAMHIADRTKTEVSLIVLDLNKFKEINDTLGHHIGDRLLSEMSVRLADGVRNMDTVARLGGDEFAIILSQINAGDTVVIADKLSRLIQDPFDFDGKKLVVSGSIGIARYPTHTLDPAILMQCADVAMYVAKRSGVNHVTYDATMDASSHENLILISELRSAIEQDQLSLNYQPKILIENGTVSGVEALLRWKHPTRGFVPPDHFIPLAEQAGLIGQLTLFVLDTAFNDLHLLQEHGHDITMAINISALSLQDPELIPLLSNAVDRHHIKTSRVMLEITETAVMDKTVHASEALQSIHKLGFSISMDDFGTGHSSLVNLRHIPLQEIKIDRTFIMNMLETRDDAEIVRTIIDLGLSLSKIVVAEGVENEDILQELVKLGCHTAQGYHISRPMTFKALQAWLENYSASNTLPNTSNSASI